MPNATFHNFTDKPFTGYWDGKPKTFKPGERMYMPAYLAAHFAKHLTNRVLIEEVKGGENYTSPKFPAQVPQFMEVFNKAYIPDEEGDKGSELDQEIAAASPKGPSADIDVVPMRPITSGSAAAAAEASGPGKEAQIISPPAGDDDEFDHGGNK